MSALAKLHVAKRDLGLDDDTYRDLLERETGKRSAKGMTSAEIDKVLVVMTRSGFKGASKRRGTALEGPFAKKLQALWISGWNLGLIRDRRDQALLAFVERQTGLVRTEWLRDPAQARKAVEALKAWLARDGGVDWSTEGQAAHALRHGCQIARAQFEKLHPGASPTLFWGEVRRIAGIGQVGAKPTDAQWITVMNVFGERIRSAASEKVA